MMADQALSPAVIARISLIKGEGHWLYGNLTGAKRCAEHAHQLFRKVQDPAGDGDAYLLDYHIEVDQGNVDQWKSAMTNACVAYQQANDNERFEAAMAYRATAEAFTGPSAFASNFKRRYESRQQPESAALALVYFAVASRFSLESNFLQAADYYLRASELLNTFGLVRASINAQINAAGSQGMLGWVDDGLCTVSQALARARVSGFPQPLGLALYSLGESHSRAGADLAEGYRFLRSAKSSLEPLRNSRTYVLVLIALGDNSLKRLAALEALDYFQEAVDASTQSQHQQLLTASLAGLAECQSMLERPLEALETAMKSRAGCDPSDVQQIQASLLSLARVCGRHQLPAPDHSRWPSGDLHYLDMLSASRGPIEDSMDDEILLEHALAWERQGNFRRALHFERRRLVLFKSESKRKSESRLASIKAQQRAIIAEAEAEHQGKLAAGEKRRTEMLERLASVVRHLTSTLEVSEIIQAICTGIEDLMGDKDVYLWLVDHGRIVPHFFSVAPRRESELFPLAATSTAHLSLEQFRQYLGQADGEDLWVQDRWMCSELKSGSTTLAFLAASANKVADFDGQAAQAFGNICGYASIALSNAFNFQQIKSAHEQLRAAQTELHQLVNVDVLTGLATRRNILQFAERELARAQRNRAQLAILLLDLDHFKNINDSHGHAAGDRVLSTVARALLAEMRTTDCLGRWGGEELVAVLYGSGDAHTEIIAERLRSCVESLQIPVCDGAGSISVTVSIGVAQWSLCDESLDGLFKRADVALYDAKRGGRNRVALSSAAVRPAA